MGVEVGVQQGLFMETLVTTCHTCELMFGVDPWETQAIYADFANDFDQEKFFQVCVDQDNA